MNLARSVLLMLRPSFLIRLTKPSPGRPPVSRAAGVTCTPGVLPVFVVLQHMCRRAHSRAAAAAKRCRSVGASDRHINEVALAQWSVSDDIYPWRSGLCCFRHQLFDLDIVVLSAFSQNVSNAVPDAVVSVYCRALELTNQCVGLRFIEFGAAYAVVADFVAVCDVISHRNPNAQSGCNNKRFVVHLRA